MESKTDLQLTRRRRRANWIVAFCCLLNLATSPLRWPWTPLDAVVTLTFTAMLGYLVGEIYKVIRSRR